MEKVNTTVQQKYNALQQPLALVISISLSVASCAQFQDRQLKPSESIGRIETRTLSDTNLKQFINTALNQDDGQPIPLWNLDRLSLAAIYYHPDLALARAQADTASAAITTAGQRPNPNVLLSPTWVTNLAAAATPWIIAANINLPIETAGKRGFRLDKAKHQTNAARLRITDAAWLVRGRLRVALLEVYAATETVRLLKQQLGIQQSIMQRLEQQRSVGEIGPLEITRSNIAVKQLQLNASAAHKRAAESRVLLATAIGIPVEGLDGIALDFTPLASPPNMKSLAVAQLKQQALLHRPDILAALADYAAAQATLQLEIANQYPNIQVNPGYTFDLGANYWSLGATALQLPIFHQNQGLIAEAEAKRQESAVRFEALQLRILGDIDKAHAGVAAVMAKWDAAEQQIHIGQDNLDTLQSLTKLGETDQLALLGAQLEAAVTERARFDVLVETQQALNVLEDSLRIPLASTFSTALIANSANKKNP
ncbi:MAG: TolC family protein [Methylococcaceae bacterium]|jgi:outer membrane protein TolC